MACTLDRDASGKYDFVSDSGSTPTIRVAGINSAAGIVLAKLNNQVLPLQGPDTVTFTVRAGINIFKLVVHVADPSDTVQVLEECGGGKTQLLEQFPNDPKDPATGFSIFGF
jgi:hypothetical protein